MATTYAVQIDQDKDDTWDAANDDITAYVRSARTSLGFRDHLSHIAQLGSCSLILDNPDKRFTPGTSPYDSIEFKGLPIRIQATSGSTWTTWRGYIDRVYVEPGQGGIQTARFECEDMLGQLSRASISMPLQQNKNQSELYKLIGSEAFRTAFATGTLTFTANVESGDTIIIGDKTYTFVAALTAANQVLIGTAKEDSAANLVAAILDDNESDDAGTQVYGSATFRSEQVTAELSGAVITITAQARGAAGNAIAMSTANPMWHAESVEIDVGSVTSGTIEDTYEQDHVYLQLAETVGTPGFTYRFLFSSDLTDDKHPVTLYIYGRYEGNPAHTVDVEYLNLTPSAWTNVGTLPSSGSDALHTFSVPGGANWLSGLAVRINHTSAGNVTHNLYIDHMYVSASEASTVPGITLSGATLSGGVDGPVGLFSYEDGKRTFNMAANDWDDRRTVAYRALRDVVNSEYGYIYVSRAGVLTAWDKDREFELPAETAAITINNTHYEQTGEYGGIMYNRAEVSYTPPGETVSQIVAKANRPIKIPPNWGGYRWNKKKAYPGSGSAGALEGGTVTVRLPFVESETGNVVGATDVVTPVRGTDYTLNRESDGSGFDATNIQPSPVRLSMVVTGSGVEITFINLTVYDGYAIDIQVPGKAIITYDEQQLIRENEASITAYGLRKITQGMPIASGEVYAESVAMFLVSRYKDPRFFISSITIYDANETIGGVHPQSIEIGSVITLSEAQTGTSSGKYYVRAIDGDIKSGGKAASVTWHIKRLDDFTAWILGIPAYSTLGYTTRPGL